MLVESRYWSRKRDRENGNSDSMDRSPRDVDGCGPSSFDGIMDLQSAKLGLRRADRGGASGLRHRPSTATCLLTTCSAFVQFSLTTARLGTDYYSLNAYIPL